MKKQRPYQTIDHDGIYHQLFSHPGMMEDLVRHFVSEPWVDDLDFSAMTPIKTKYRAHGLPKRDSDIVWGPKSRDGGWSGLVWSDLSEFV